jgi:large subunit ribosomal protein L4
MELTVLNIDGKSTGKKVVLNEGVFGIEPNEHAIYLDVKRYLAAQRTGTHKAKERSEVAYSTKKLKKQKGTGGARAGSRKSPVFVGGGTIFGPRPRSYDIKINDKVKKLAKKSALSAKAKSDSIMVLDKMALASFKTKEMVNVLKNLQLHGVKTLVVVPAHDKSSYLAIRNIPGQTMRSAAELNTYDIMNSKKILLVENSHEVIEKYLNN